LSPENSATKKYTSLYLNPAFTKPGKHEKIENIQTQTVTGTTIKIDLQNHMKMQILEFIVTEPVLIFNAKHHFPSLGIGFCLNGQLNADLKILGEKYIISRGESSLFYISNIYGSYTYFCKKPLNRVFIEFEPHYFLNFLNDERDILPQDLLDALEKDEQIFHRSNDTVTSEMMFIINQILSCPYHGAARNFFFQGKAFELIASKLSQFQKYKKTSTDGQSPIPVDIERIIHAKELLAENLQNPPSIGMLAKKVGASRTKLYKDFCKIHGDTPTNFLRDLRIKEAELLIREGKMNITEVAYAVGYSNISYFAKVFRKYYSVPPSIYLKNLHSGKKLSYY